LVGRRGGDSRGARCGEKRHDIGLPIHGRRGVRGIGWYENTNQVARKIVGLDDKLGIVVISPFPKREYSKSISRSYSLVLLL
jgi:hypothetical protein